ncbi:hypothetical protein GYA28_01710 [Candidatus Roizmanbacteria bacterium]|nr:hypothetical protein [Candidatus Roizmanbacteria bacterium]
MKKLPLKEKISHRSFREKITPFLTAAFLFFLPTQLGRHFFFDYTFLSGVKVDYLSPTIYLTDIIVFFLVLFNLDIVIKSFDKKKLLFAAGFILINIFISPVKPVAVYRAVKICEFVCLFLIFSQSKIADKAWLKILSLSGLVQFSLAAFQLISKHSLQGPAYLFGERYLSLGIPAIAKASLFGVEILRPYGSFSHPNSLAGFYLLLYFYVSRNKKFSRFIYWKSFFLFLSTGLILMSFSKAAIITYILLNFFATVLDRKKLDCRICTLSKIIVVLLIGTIFLQAEADPLSMIKRKDFAVKSLSIFRNNLAFGIGGGNYLVGQNRFPDFSFDTINQPVHNIFLLFVSEYGIAGLIIGLIIGYKKIKKVALSNPYVLIAVFLTGMVDHYWLTLQQNFLLIPVLFGSI